MRVRLIAPAVTAADKATGGQRFIIDIDPSTGDARIVREGAALIECDSSACLAVRRSHSDEIDYIDLRVEAA